MMQRHLGSSCSHRSSRGLNRYAHFSVIFVDLHCSQAILRPVVLISSACQSSCNWQSCLPNFIVITSCENVSQHHLGTGTKDGAGIYLFLGMHAWFNVRAPFG